jgi:hypothetical protein
VRNIVVQVMLARGEIKDTSSVESLKLINAALDKMRMQQMAELLQECNAGNGRPQRERRAFSPITVEDCEQKEIFFAWGHAKEAYAMDSFITGASSSAHMLTWFTVAGEDAANTVTFYRESARARVEDSLCVCVQRLLHGWG